MVQLVTRISKGSPLTYLEMDNNLVSLKTGIDTLSTTVESYITDNDVVVSFKADRSELATVAFSGDYRDLLNKPQLVNASWKIFEE
jgi:hypothetical protein